MSIVSLSLNQIQRELLDLLLFFDRFCSDNKLRYSLAYGTLLGAVRHKGFIPWDDDIDVSMPRPDYERLLSLGSHMPPEYRVITNQNSSFVLPFAKIQNLSVRAQEPAYEGVLQGYLWLDIFPVDGVPNSKIQQERLQMTINSLMKRRMWLSLGPSGKNGARMAIKQTYCLLHSDPKSIDRIDLKISALTKKNKYQDATYVSSLMGGAKRVIALKKEDYENMLTMEFEGHAFPVASCWDADLSKDYGDYMTLPPENQRPSHYARAWYVTTGDEAASRRPAQEEGGPHA